MIRTSWQYSLDEELERQAGTMRRLGYTTDYLEGVAAFLEKRPPRFTGN
jgi:2-(1,2-epoxy-1,2-dihydrophenyl)acetyl-CoA isomerase